MTIDGIRRHFIGQLSLVQNILHELVLFFLNHFTGGFTGLQNVFQDRRNDSLLIVGKLGESADRLPRQLLFTSRQFHEIIVFNVNVIVALVLQTVKCGVFQVLFNQLAFHVVFFRPYLAVLREIVANNNGGIQGRIVHTGHGSVNIHAAFGRQHNGSFVVVIHIGFFAIRRRQVRHQRVSIHTVFR